MLPVACRRCIHLIAELGLTSNHSAASRRDAPDSTASTTRSRNSKEHGFGIDALQNSNQCHQIRLSKSSRESRFNPAEIRSSTAYEWGVVAEVVPNGKALSRARELAALYLKAPEVTRRDTRIHFIQPLKERIVREVGYGLSLEGASSAALTRSRVKNEAA